MPFKRKRSNLVLREEERSYLLELSRSRTEPHGKVKRAKMILAYADGVVSWFSVKWSIPI